MKNTTNRKVDINFKSIKDVLLDDVVPVGSKFLVKGLVSEVNVVNKDAQNEYISLTIGDNGFMCNCKIWGSEIFKNTIKDKDIMSKVRDFKIQKSLVVAIYGEKEKYKDKIYIKVILIKEMNEPVSEYVEKTDIPVTLMFEFLKKKAESIRSPYKDIIKELLVGNGSELALNPASKISYCNFSGGLLEHTFKMLSIFDNTASLYDGIDGDIVIFSIIYLGIANVGAYTLLPTIEITQQELMVGGVQMSIIPLYNSLKGGGVNDDTIVAIINILLSNCFDAIGNIVKKPMTIEAQIVKSINILSSRTSLFEHLVKKSEDDKLGVDMFRVKYQ